MKVGRILTQQFARFALTSPIPPREEIPLKDVWLSIVFFSVLFTVLQYLSVKIKRADKRKAFEQHRKDYPRVVAKYARREIVPAGLVGEEKFEPVNQ